MSVQLFNIWEVSCRNCKNILVSWSWRINYFAFLQIRSQLLLLVCASNSFQREHSEINVLNCFFYTYSSWSPCQNYHQGCHLAPEPIHCNLLNTLVEHGPLKSHNLFVTTLLKNLKTDSEVKGPASWLLPCICFRHPATYASDLGW